MASVPPSSDGGGNGVRDRHKWAESKVYTRKSFNKGSKSVLQSESQTLGTENSSRMQQFDAVSDDESPPMARSSANGSLRSNYSENRVKINLSSKSKKDLRELRLKLTSELERIRATVKRIEAKELQFSGYSIGGYSQSQMSANNGGKRGNSEVASVDPPLRPLHQLSISVVENSGISDTVEKEKRTPKVNQYYLNSNFVVGKEKIQPQLSNKKSKSSGNKKISGIEGGYSNMSDNQLNKIFKSCSNLLSELMKNKHAWVFNSPVDVKALGLHDYYTIIKHPMDLGTIKSRLSKNYYLSPEEFAEDVKLTFKNAMTYNPEGQDVHVMAKQLSMTFEEQWARLEVSYNLDSRTIRENEETIHSKAMKKVHAPQLNRVLDRSESTTLRMDPVKKHPPFPPSGRVLAPKKPKAKDPHKRDMTYEEKQKLSTNLQNLPPEKLDNIVQIIKKRNSSLCQDDDEIEVDIDSVDTETLWELDRFVTNYKKSLSKNKKKAELALQAQARNQMENTSQKPVQAPVPVEVAKESKKDEEKNVVSSSSPPREREKQVENASRSSSSSSSSSDSGSSSSDSDSESSSGSDVAHSPRS